MGCTVSSPDWFSGMVWNEGHRFSQSLFQPDVGDTLIRVMYVRAENRAHPHHEVRFPMAGDGEKLFDPWASRRKGQECPQEIRTKKFMLCCVSSLTIKQWREAPPNQPTQPVLAPQGEKRGRGEEKRRKTHANEDLLHNPNSSENSCKGCGWFLAIGGLFWSPSEWPRTIRVLWIMQLIPWEMFDDIVLKCLR